MRGRKPAAPRTADAEAAHARGVAPPAVAMDEPDWTHLAGEEWGPAAARYAAERWQVIRREMERLGTLGPENGTQLEAAAVLYARWRLAEAKIAKLGPVVMAKNGMAMPNPYLSVAQQALDRLMKIEGDLGLTPAMRARVGKVKANRQTLDGGTLKL